MNRPFKKEDTLTQQDIKRYNGYIWKTVITGFVIVVLLIGSTALGLFGPLPSLRDLENPKSNVASEILSADGKVFGRYYVEENRTAVPYDQISPNVINALIATEDNHFMEHSGIDFWRSFSIIFYNIIGKRQGASTITQQLALNQFSEEARAKGVIARGIQKLKEQIIAVRLEKHYTKQEIITMYLNTVYYGSGSYGISAAAGTFFNTTADKLTPDQAAVLVGVLKGPSLYSPVNRPENALNRRNFVLARMADMDEKALTEGQVKEYQAKPLGLNFHPISDKQGLAPYFRKELKDAVKKILADNNVTKSDGTPYDLNRDGLKIYTTIDATMQEYAEEAQRQHMAAFQNTFNKQWKGINLKKSINNYDRIVNAGMRRSKRWEDLVSQGKSEDEIIHDFNTVDTVNVFTWHGRVDTLMKPIDSVVYTKMLIWNSMMSMDPTTGYIKAWVGGINFQQTEYDQVYQGKRQVGSTAKPFTYAAAIDQGISPCTGVDNVPVTIGDWTPRSDPKSTLPGRITLKQALAYSQNYVTAWVMNQVGAMPVAELIKKMGITSNVPAYPSIALGVFDASVYDMTGAYSAFVNQGVWTEPTFLLRIEDKNGTVLYTHTPKKQQVINDQTAYAMTDMLKGVITKGTGSRLNYKYKLNAVVGGKTGTTQGNADGWFIGITPRLVTGVWTGCENRDFAIRNTNVGQGAASALPVFAYYMQKVYGNASLGYTKTEDFALPKSGEVTIELNCDAYAQQSQGVGEVEEKLGF
ncbi:transglycosylase domain-containing protein [Mucilaginibacter auburnensis]|uniref:Penicillin-binding protein 1A n=1 Tax=Mucilaginibacter auburnensis TaxID=1457233 RepID=A0A2H9VNB0_9SPHI|nr:transglycosylase domain-containing protein [Mucilaginibacter auburnensis]PJJ79816.1 penicillin-binding protein 1A [Mucilaginibacter auburnensis]